MKKLLVVGVIVLFLGMSVIPSTGKTDVKQVTMPTTSGNILYVGGNGTGNYTKIQDAINDSINGDTVFVYDDSSPYFENIKIRKSINLIGENRNTTIIDGNYSGYTINILENYVVIKGFTIIHGNSSGISLWISVDCTITDNIITSNNHSSIFLSGSSNNITDNNISNNEYSILIFGTRNNISGNNISNSDYGICLGSSSNNIISCNNIISNNHYGICLFHSDNNTITGNNISNNEEGIRLDESRNNTFIGNNISNNDEGINIWYSRSNIIIKNNFIDNKRNTYFENCTSTWKQNYWNRPRILPKLIFGTMNLGNFTIPWFNIDWHPAQEPYDIGV